ncbi:MAG: GntR family transcriptional regulator [Elainellaceae cyanobacterium]
MSTSVPLHISISEQLREQIEAGQYQPGDRLPSEHQLMKTFDVSRITVRQAIANLTAQGLANSHQGKGVFVALQQKVAYSLSSPLVFLEEDMARQGIRFTSSNLAFDEIEASETVRARLRLTREQTVYRQKKLLFMDGAAGAVDVSYILPELGQRFAHALTHQMTFPTLENNGIPIEAIDATIECTHASYETSQHLEVPLGQPLIVYRYTAYRDDDQPVVYGETISRADRFCYALSTRRSRPD